MTELDPDDYTDQYDELLDEVYPPVKFGELTYSPSYVLKTVDLIAYREGLLDYVDSIEVDSIESDIDDEESNDSDCHSGPPC